ncbi:MAG: 4Fe-4S dicluster domain-containing protein [Lentisphaeria bacterium]|nr:4Fe-4S dicluster domain-containing protein [Lentisphaeria bacterium]
MRLDFYLSLLRLPKKNRVATKRSKAYHFARKILPSFLFSNYHNGIKQNGFVRRVLRATGKSWISSPWRRTIQSFCFIGFLLLFFYSCWPYTATPDVNTANWPSHYADDLAKKELVDAEIFLALDPLVSISTAIAARSWVWSLGLAGLILAISVFIPRGFCGYICPLGTLIDLFDWSIANRIKKFQVKENGWWVHLKYYLLLAIIIASFMGILISGIFAAIPIITRGLLFIFGPLQMGFMRDWHQVPPLNAGHYVSILLFLGVFALSFLKARFWCKYVCPSGAVFSIGNLFTSVTERKVEDSCINCDHCIKVCPFDAIKADYSTRTMDCTLCQTCAGACPTQSIKFVERWNTDDLKAENDPPLNEIPMSRKGFIAGAAAGLVTAMGIQKLSGADLDTVTDESLPVRPPGSVPEKEFLQLCIRCGECFKACPNNVIQPLSFEQGLEGLWTPEVVADWSGCEPSCNNCGQVCPTGAIRAIPLEEKKVAKMGLAILSDTCLPIAGKEACQLCVDECTAAGYNALEFERMHVKIDDDGMPVEGSGYSAPVMIAEKCVGCGLCQSACYRINVEIEEKLENSAIIIYAGEGREDRIMNGSYISIREREKLEREKKNKKDLKNEPDFY